MPLSSITLNTLYFLCIIFIILFLRSRILERYYLFEVITPFFIILTIITFIMLSQTLLELLNIIFEKNLNVLTIVFLFILSLPFMLALSVPMAVLMSTILVFGRMSVDQELTAAKSTGVNILKMTKLLVVMVMIITVGMAYFNDFVLPETNHTLKKMMIRITYQKPITAIKPGTFTTINDLTIYAKGRSNEALLDLLIFNNENRRFPQTIQAKKGEMLLDPVSDQLKITLYDGEIHERDQTAPDQYQIIQFSKYIFYKSDLGYEADETITDYRGDREINSIQIKKLREESKDMIKRLNIESESLEKRITEPGIIEHESSNIMSISPDNDEFRKNTVLLQLKKSQIQETEKQIRIYTLEMHKKYSLAAACIIFLIVGLPIGMMTKTSGIGVSLLVSSLIFLVYYIFLIVGEEMGERGIINPALGMWFPSLIFLVIGLFLLYFAGKEKQFDISKLIKPLQGLFQNLIKYIKIRTRSN